MPKHKNDRYSDRQKYVIAQHWPLVLMLKNTTGNQTNVQIKTCEMMKIVVVIKAAICSYFVTVYNAHMNFAAVEE